MTIGTDEMIEAIEAAREHVVAWANSPENNGPFSEEIYRTNVQIFGALTVLADALRARTASSTREAYVTESGRLTGSREPDPSFTGSGPSGFDPERTPLPGDIVQITNSEHHWFPCLVVVSENKSFGIQGFVFMPTNDGGGTGEAYTRLNFADFEPVGAAALVLSQSTADERAIAMEARQRRDAEERPDPKDDSAGRLRHRPETPSLQTPQGGDS